MKKQRFIQRYWQQRSLLSDLLYPASLLYERLGRIKQQRQAGKAYLAPFKVIGIGNISSGGSGKTPLTMALAKAAIDSGFKTAVSHRGYKSAMEKKAGIVSMGAGCLYGAKVCGDEAWMSATKLSKAYVSVGRDRVAQLELLATLEEPPELVVIDDVFQNQSVIKDVSIVCFDAKTGLGNGRVIPAGYLRESVSAVARADICVINRKDPGIEVESLKEELRERCEQIFVIDHSFCGFEDYQGNAVDVDINQPSLLLSALASPQSFEATAQSLNINYLKHYSFSDHYSFGSREALAPLLEQIRVDNIRQIFCSHKDLPKLLPHKDLVPLLRVIMIEANPFQFNALWQAIKRRIEL